MLPHVLADLIMVLHLAFVLFVAVGGLLAWRWPGVAYAHVPSFLWGAWIHLAGRICPLTPLENHLRARAGASGYTGGFVEHYLLPVLYPDFLPRPTSVGLGVCLLVFNTLLYGRMLYRVRPRQGGAAR
jgi:hypothetical protein